MSRVAVVGATGFVGSAVAAAAEGAGHAVLRVAAPRLSGAASDRPDAEAVVRELAVALQGADVVVNCAGNPDASSADVLSLRAANAVLPGLVGAAARSAGVERYIHVSSAVVQGRRPVLDDTEALDAFSPYAVSKAEGELAARAHGPEETTVYRPPSVHGAGRRVSRQLARIASSPLATVARPGTRPTPQTHIADVADALLFLATTPRVPPRVVHHPWQGHTTAGLLTVLADGREPVQIPGSLARALLRVGGLVAHLAPRLGPHLRRVEMIWFGQEQAPSWLTAQGWRPVTTRDDWLALGRAARPTRDTDGISIATTEDTT
jgi:nucleoside-diphosphate-sugar epimerase